MINTILVVIILLLVIICLILVYLLMKSKTTISYKYEPINNIQEEEIPNLVFHNNIEKMDYHLLVKTCMLIFDSFKALDYKNSDEKVLAQIEWHSWQVSLLLALIQKNGQLFLPDLKNHIPSVIVQMPKESVEFEIKRIKKKYYENVNISKNRDQLSKHVIWSVKEVSLIFYYLTFDKK